MPIFIQKTSYDFQLNSQSNFYYLDRYLINNGITGEGQIITITDMLIDFYHSMFRDDQNKLKSNEFLPNHRKIINYNFNGNLTDLRNIIEEDEHGTHVVGTTSGKMICYNDLKGTHFFDGNAPDAKILYAGYFNDVEAPDIVKLMKDYKLNISKKVGMILNMTIH